MPLQFIFRPIKQVLNHELPKGILSLTHKPLILIFQFIFKPIKQALHCQFSKACLSLLSKKLIGRKYSIFQSIFRPPKQTL